ncbi:LOW QUALITY PROTEIN: DNA-directed RNA polymerase, mitochondrial [Conger conger]|uniref:LOW QUALITY PROTEIN: DNA-directed RNA polymerase, mitochondrial n=1 Tax=Conger conger TaxID=82655 RepID=UPI002A5A8528|nr:LOW QUALITY PROTEIN: DNA-directed RNA polymerase, mitochondrial [Conger conger]
MSLLRICAFSRCQTARILFETNPRHTFYSDRCHVFVRIQNGCHRRIAETPWTAYRRNYSALIPKKDDGKKRFWEQSHLLDVLEARIQQLQSDVFLDIKHSEVQFVNFSQAGEKVTPKKGQTSCKKEGPDPSPQNSSGKHWLKRLNHEKLTREQKFLCYQQELKGKGGKGKKKVSSTTVDPEQKGRSTKGKASPLKEDSSLAKVDGEIRPSPPHKKDSSLLSRPQKKDSSLTKVLGEIRPSPPHKKDSSLLSRPQKNDSSLAKVDGEIRPSPPHEKDSSLFRCPHERDFSLFSRPHEKDFSLFSRPQEKDLSLFSPPHEKDLSLFSPPHEKDLTLFNRPHSSLAPVEELYWDTAIYNEAQANVRCFLQACMFTGDIERAHLCLMNHHQVLSRRKLLSIGAYNYLMRVWAKKGALHEISDVFVLLDEAGMKPDLGSYVAVLESLGRFPDYPESIISKCVQQLQVEGYSLEDLFQYRFHQDEREYVLKAVQTALPDFQPSVQPKAEHCASPLVKDFYTERDNVDYPKIDFTLAELREKFGQQLAVEQSDTITIDSVEATKPTTEHMIKMRNLLDAQRREWRTLLLNALQESKRVLALEDDRPGRMNLYPYLRLLDDQEYVDIMMQCLSHLHPNGESLQSMARNLGSRVQNKFFIRQKSHMVDKLRVVYDRYAKLLAKDTEKATLLPRECWQELEAEMSSGPSLLCDDPHWPHFLVIQLGTHLADLMVRELKLPSDVLRPQKNPTFVPVLYHMYAFRNTRKIGFVKPHPIFTQLLLEAMETRLTFDAYVMPMLCPPVPWTSPRFGAYLLTFTKLMRSACDTGQHQVLLENCAGPDLHAVLDSLNSLGNCAWKVNQPLLDIIISIFNDKGCEKLDIPPPLSEAPQPPRSVPGAPAPSAKESMLLKQQGVLARRKAMEMHSLRMDSLYKLSIANAVRDQVFWFPHNMDFRGRTYPCPPYFNHLGSDVTRSILLFAEGKALGPHGLDWLKVHLVNLTGKKKRSSLAGRLEYANSVMEDILDSADQPLTGRKWWMEADEPWQALACCMEIARASRSPDPAQYVSHAPVHQDGSCNGLQHYAALGRDVIGATSVNLAPCNEPQDVYNGVAVQVEEFRAADAENGVKIAQVLEGYISRKVLKQTVMTVVYGVTRYGGRLQIEKRLKETEGFPQEHVWEASSYLVKKVFLSLNEMFTGSREIQDWLTESARLISQFGSPVEWVTPLGLPIIQPYHRSKTQMLQTHMQSMHIKVSSNTSKPDTVKQKNAFPPNFIHSLDSTHMMLTSLYCLREKLTFVSVHDCFWTHAVTVDTMNRICREQFVALHSQPILQDLSTFMVRKYSDRKQGAKKAKAIELFSRVPKTGDFDLQQVKDSTYFFS